MDELLGQLAETIIRAGPVAILLGGALYWMHGQWKKALADAVALQDRLDKQAVGHKTEIIELYREMLGED